MHEQRCNIISIFHIKQDSVTFMDISGEEDTIHCQFFFKGSVIASIHLWSCCRKKKKKQSQKGGLLDHFKQSINMDKTVTHLVEILSDFQNRFNP